MAEQRISSSADGRPIIIANGFFPFPVPLGHVAAVYRASGFDARVIPFDIRNKMCVRVYANAIANFARQMHTESGKRVDILGLSMGGISGLYAVKLMDCAHCARTVIAIGSPFHGSPIAAYGTMSPWFNRTALQLSPGSKILRELRQAKLPADVRFISLGGIFDCVCPFPTTRMEDAENYIWCFAHHDLMFLSWLHPEVVKLLI